MIGIADDPPMFNRAITNDAAASVMGASIYSWLLDYDQDLNFQPDLCQSHEVSKDGKTHTFRLASGVKWHDGKPFTSKDAKYSFEQASMKFMSSIRAVAPMFESIETPDDNTLVFKLTGPIADLEYFMLGDCAILPKHIYEGTDIQKNEANWKPIGTGPFKFGEWVKGSHITLVKNEDYFKKNLPYLDRIIVKIIPEAAARILALKTGEIHGIPSMWLPMSEVPELEKDPAFKVFIRKVNIRHSSIPIVFNYEKPILSDVRVRQAIAYAVDKKEIIEESLYGYGRVGTANVPPGSKAFDATLPNYEKPDIEEANKLLDEAGYPKKSDGTRFPLEITCMAGYGVGEKSTELVKGQLAKVGIDVKIRALERSSFIDHIFKRVEFEAYIHSLIQGVEGSYSGSWFHSRNAGKGAPWANTGYRNSRVDELYDKIAGEPDKTKIIEYRKELQKVMLEDVAWVWMAFSDAPAVYNNDFEYEHRGAGHHFPSRMDETWWKKAPMATKTTPTPTTVTTPGPPPPAPGVSSEVLTYALIAIVVVVGAIILLRRRSASSST
jgi:peptide/nickel transport system substrate-binding protein